MTAEETYDWLLSGPAPAGTAPADRHAAASILALAMAEAWADGGSAGARCGLGRAGLDALAAAIFPARRADLAAQPLGPAADEYADEQTALRELLSLNASPDSRLAPLFAAMVARRAMEPDHLWQDLGLRNRDELSSLLDRHFAPLARQNTEGMKWKRFFYRKLCEAEGFVLCTAPSCAACTDVEMCFGEETGEARLARTERRPRAAS
ncbi:nitrogen fixation protein NifQ [Rhodovulum iodosum]|uniref:Nitrogen fixation protein NifQ n=1 Tax=Rhodovulum iodosum TaxID=68291 RepID=A0ABV3XPL8_9RHOB|nr:nitrogen fixation protein NifQ [Rhodovulum robiginosum]RSK31451.1 nitrogen fixation protein NifQ [Rhodovulum robiginosum]